MKIVVRSRPQSISRLRRRRCSTGKSDAVKLETPEFLKHPKQNKENGDSIKNSVYISSWRGV